MGWLLYGRHYSLHITWINLILKTQIWGQQLYELCTIIILIYGQENWGTGKLSYLPKIKELVSNSAENQTRQSASKACALNHYTLPYLCFILCLNLQTITFIVENFGNN